MTENAEQPGSAGRAEQNPVRPRRLGAIASAVLLLAGVVGGVGYTVVTVHGADRDPGAAVWRVPGSGSGGGKKAAVSGLAGMLVPYGSDGWSRGPDMGEFGSDARLSGAEAAALRKQSLRGLPLSRRRELEKEIDGQHIAGMAMRSYVSSAENSAVYTHQASTVDIVLVQMGNEGAVRNIAAFQQAFLGALGGGAFREGPAVPDHKNAKCFLSPANREEKLDAMYCSAAQGNVLVTVTAASPRPIQSYGIARLLEEQLDRVKTPGESV